MSISRFLSLILAPIACFAIVKFAMSMAPTVRDHQTVAHLSEVSEATSSWIDGSVALSLERSVSQVALALDEPAPEAFRSIINEQRAKSDALFSAAVASIETFDFLESREAFLTGSQKMRRQVAALRAEVDAMLRAPAIERDATRAHELPFDLKRAISALKSQIALLRIQNDVTSSQSQTLFELQDRAWEVREFGGRARTYYAIAALKQTAIPSDAKSLIIADTARAETAWRVIEALAQSIDVPTALKQPIDNARAAYFGEYVSTLARMDAAMATAKGGDPVSLPIDFDAFFALSNNALGGMEALSETAGDEVVAYWRDRSDKAMYELTINAIALFAVVLLLSGAMVLINRRVARPLSDLRTALERLVGGEDVGIPGKERTDEIGALANTMEQIRDRGQEAARIRIGLDSSKALVMLADNAFNIVFLNAPLMQALKEAERDIRADLPNFDASRLIGTNIDVFHKNPSHQRKMIEALTSTHNARLKLGGRQFALAVSPVRDADGVRLGTIVEWRDMTAEIRATEEIDAVVSAALEGDLTRRADVAGAPPMLQEMGERLNRVAEAVDKSVHEANRVICAMAEGDLEQRVSGEFKGVFAELRDGVNETASRLSELIGQIAGTSVSVQSNAVAITQGSGDLSTRVEQQASSLQETAATMEEMSASIKSNADNAQNAKALASNASGRAAAGGGVVKGAVSAMNEIEAGSTKIADIISVIDGIAFQTNLLALNAAVEAARAGDAGKGFAVVASEVRALAQRSSEAARDIRALIETSAGQVSEGVRLVSETGVSLEGIVASIAQVEEAIQSIAAASIEQASGVEEISASVSHMDQMTQQNSTLADQSAANARGLSESADKLQELISFFEKRKATVVEAGDDADWRRVEAQAPAPSSPRPAAQDGGEWAAF